MSENVFDTLKERGLIAQSTDESAIRSLLGGAPITFYTGYDCTATSLHAGNMVPIMAMMHLQRAGHHPIAVVGRGTTMVGDPSGKTELRQLLDEESLRTFSTGIHAQLDRFLDFQGGRATAVDNADWLLGLAYIPFLREIGRHFSVNRMLTAEAYRLRLERGLSFIEFNYQILQAYDYLHLYRSRGCVLQLGGDDQWGNILAGVDLIRRVEGREVHAMTFPLLTTSSGAKMGKTAGGAVWLDAALLGPYDYYQYWINCEDADVVRLLKVFTFLPLDEIARLGRLEGADLRTAKRTLAFEATRIAHGEAAAAEAEATAQAAFGGGTGDLDAMPSSMIARAALAAGLPLAAALTDAGLTRSRGEARRLIEQGGVYVNDTRVADVETRLTEADLREDAVLLRSGKKKYHRLVVGH
jgi:tyrosyl-tRNA synthetase